MGKAKITVTGMASKPPKVKEDKTVDLLIKVDMSPAVPKGLKSLGQSICLVHIGLKTWKKVAGAVKDDSYYIIQGEVKSNVNNKSVPFLEVVAFDISLKPEATQPKEKEEQSNQSNKQQNPKKVIEQPKTKREVQEQKQKTGNKEKNVNNSKKTEKSDKNKGKGKYSFKKWYEPDEIKYVSYTDLVLEEQLHLESFSVGLRGELKLVSEGKPIKNPLAVRAIQNGKYALITGFKYYIVSKALGLEKVPVVIKDMTYDEFIKEYAIDVNVHYVNTK